MINKKNLKFFLIEIFLILSYLICWFSISTSLNDIQILLKRKYKFK